jgi:hypothetical protein
VGGAHGGAPIHIREATMPFTLCHPVATLPLHALARRRLPLAGLVVGSMMPDLGYFFAPAPGFRADNHTLLRSLTFCLPWGLVVLALLTLLEEGWLELLPTSLRPEAPLVTWSARTLPGLGAAVVLGSWTHALWDGWTHAGGWFVRRLPPLAVPIAGGLSVAVLLQLASTAFGAIVLVFIGRRRLRRLRLDWRCGFWLAAVTAATGLGCARALAAHDPSPLFAIVTSAVHDLVVTAAAAALAIRVVKLAAARLRPGAASSSDPG